jgi:glutamate synthase domain-containing protein 2
MWITLGVIAGLLLALALYDLTQTRHAILRNFPVIGHLRYLLEAVGPELRQYIVTSNDEELPFSRDQRRWVYASSKRQNNYFGFGTDNELERSPNYLIIKQSTFPLSSPQKSDPAYDSQHPVPCAKVLGGWRGREHAFRPQSIVNVSAMSFGSLSAAAVRAINEGCATSQSMQNTGEGGIAPYHDHGGKLIWQLGTGYFGARAPDGGFSMSLFLETLAAHNVSAIEIKLSQGAKPGRGGVLPAAKVTPEIAKIRGVPVGEDVLSPAGHTAFSDPDSLLDFVEMLATESGLPVGIKSAIGELQFWEALTDQMVKTDRGVDFVTIDGGEGGTGAAPLVFSDHVALPFKVALSRVYSIFAHRDLHEKIVFVGGGKLGFPESALLAIAMGCDLINVAREAMMAIGCIQAQRCHTGHCPTGVATQNAWLMRGLDPTHKGNRLANYLITLRKEILWLAHACGVAHPSLVTPEHFEILDGRFGGVSAHELFRYEPGWGMPAAADRREIERIMTVG